ncbi:MAG: TonB-dependent receptor [Sphingomonas sp.]|uniref:TonB-dependent receptor n=1 Tax=Sphingomonas sp. TaxID=28214 RepID=UPI0025D82EDC|nr:TonB-dependent receptor [Sphingomonas sp.]MBY0285058.1 TonB-dependent receptor [Sphingomonas sp.]
MAVGGDYMIGSNVRRVALLGGLSAIALLAAPAAAQKAAPGAAQSGPEQAPAANAADQEADVVVTAQKREQNLSDVPAAIQAISGDTLERRGTKDLTQLVEFIPGASIVSKAAPGFETIQIRGISSGTVGDATVGYYIDDVIFSIPNLQLAPPSRLINLERTEILRGPQGTLYGNGAMGGLIRLVTTKPNTTKFTAKGQGEVSFTDGGGTNYAGDAAFNFPLATDKAALGVSGGYERLSGFADGALGNNLNGIESWNIRGKLFLKPTDNLDVNLSIWHINNHQDYSNNLLRVDPPRVHEPFGITPFIDTVATFYSGSVKWDLGTVSLESGTSYIDHKLRIDSVVNSPLAVAPGVVLPVGIRNNSTFATSSFNQELRLVSQGSGPFSWIVGGLYTNATIRSDIDVNIRGLGPAIPFLNVVGAPLKTESFAFFGEASYSLFDGKLIPLIGLRYFNDVRTASGPTTFGGVTRVDSGRGNFDALSPRFNLTYKPSDDALIYINVARGFRSGTIQTGAQAQLGQLSGVTTGVIINPDSLWTYEIGTKLKLPAGFYFDGSFYYTDWTNIQIPFNTPFGLPSVVNGGNARIYGVDLGLNWRTPLRGLTLQGVVNFNNSTFQNINPQLTAVSPTARNGSQLPGVPKNNYSVGATYSGKIAESLNFNFYGAYSFRNRQQDLASGLFGGQIENLTLRAGLEIKRLRFDIFADNITNEKGPILFTPTAQQAVYPRRIGLSVTMKY